MEEIIFQFSEEPVDNFSSSYLDEDLLPDLGSMSSISI